MEKSFKVIKGDITQQKTDAVVNAANKTLLGGGGVDGAIHKAAGPMLLAKCVTLGGCKTGEAKITPGYNLPAEYVIHTVGPVWRGGDYNEHQLLADCYKNSLRLAEEYRLSSVSFPSISTGAYRFPLPEAAKIAVREIGKFLQTSKNVKEIYMVAFSDSAYLTYKHAPKE
ncbi:O-acetyl-ADP-ribose deacetylase [Sedimentisphaera cyanobacteriorum]|uniref:O-acetyl-ADP-ribose deacetylase n=1 Tax=Sedimentisphaera cyanobacteriorum TaxID=1940790 RepID=A0A1Q2HPL8_9BACT|nr:O-acetyl-ADP-ribose deacetylase [Sedimentisphaera cyanobacteriorum]AQQ09224.1 O-acetyl-ADP-ribose deacetylase [Sedimentisphaera cyanobacteriorum]